MTQNRQRALRTTFCLGLLALGGCSTIDGWVDSLKRDRSANDVPLEQRPVQAPLDSSRFVLASPDQAVVGEPQVVFAGETDTFSDLARTYGLGFDELVAANPDIDPWLPGEGTPVMLPTQFVLPDAARQGVVLNIATKRLFYYPQIAEGEAREVLTYPIGIGRVGWETPLGSTKVIAKAKDPSWWVPASVRKEHAEMGDPLPAVVGPGPDNPLGHRVLKLDMPGYLIHGTNQPYGVGMRVSHGCIRLYPENIEHLYSLVDIGVPVEIVNQPYLFALQDGRVFFEAHAPLEDDAVQPPERLAAVLDPQRDAADEPLTRRQRELVHRLAELATGVPVMLAMNRDDEYLDRVRVVENTVTADPDAYTLEEIRELMDEVAAE